MATRQAVNTCVVHREGKQVSVAPGEKFDFTKEELETFEALGAVTSIATVDLEKEGDKGGSKGDAPEYLSGNVAQVTEKIKALDDETLKGAAEAEAKGLNRKGVLEAIDAEIKGRSAEL